MSSYAGEGAKLSNLNHDDKLLPLRNSGADFRTTLIHDPVDRGHDMVVAHIEQGRSAIRRQLKSQLLLPGQSAH
jgi:hypothetical protein